MVHFNMLKWDGTRTPGKYSRNSLSAHIHTAIWFSSMLIARDENWLKNHALHLFAENVRVRERVKYPSICHASVWHSRRCLLNQFKWMIRKHVIYAKRISSAFITARVVGLVSCAIVILMSLFFLLNAYEHTHTHDAHISIRINVHKFYAFDSNTSVRLK